MATLRCFHCNLSTESHLTPFLPLPIAHCHTVHTSKTMKLTVSSISFTTACAVFIEAHSNAVMASVVNAAYENEVEQATDKHSKTRSLGEECSFASSGLRSNDADIGILDCAENFVCAEDERSSLGGRCVSADMQHRKLETCTKCTGNAACVGLSTDFINNKIADDACCGQDACQNIDEGKTLHLTTSSDTLHILI